MIITCPACAIRYDLPDGAIPAEGRTVRCANCHESWFEPGSLDALSPATDQFADQVPGSPDQTDGAGPIVPPLPTPAPPVFERLPSIAPDAAAAIAPPTPPPAAQPTEVEREPTELGGKPPLVPRRQGLKNWLLVLLAAIVLLVAIGGALVWYGPPDWLPVKQATFAKARPGLVLDFPKADVERKTLADGTEYFGARGTITNTGSTRQSVPPLLIVLRDAQHREVYRWEVDPPKQQLGPGETMTINQAVTDIPRSATVPEIGWKSA